MDWLGDVFNFDDYGTLLWLVRNSILAGAVLGLVGGLIGVFVMQRDMAFAVHGISELAFAGAAAALLVGADVILGSIGGSVIAALIIGAFGARARDRNSIVGVLMPAGLGLGILFLALYPGRSANKLSLLTGQIIAIDDPGVVRLIIVSIVVLVALLFIWRPLTFASLDPESATAKGVPERALSIGFLLLLGLITAVSVQIVGALLVLALLVTPAAAALRVATSPLVVALLASLFGLVSAVGGILLAIAGSLPISPFITTISFLIYLACRIIGALELRARAISGSRRGAGAGRRPGVRVP